MRLQVRWRSRTGEWSPSLLFGCSVSGDLLRGSQRRCGDSRAELDMLGKEIRDFSNRLGIDRFEQRRAATCAQGERRVRGFRFATCF